MALKYTLVTFFAVSNLAATNSFACSKEDIARIEYDGHSGNAYRCSLVGDGPDIRCNRLHGGPPLLLTPVPDSSTFSSTQSSLPKNTWVYTFDFDYETCQFLPGVMKFFNSNGEITQQREESLGRPVAIGASDVLNSNDVQRNQWIELCVAGEIRALESRIGRQDDFNMAIFDERRREARTDCARRLGRGN